MSTHPLEIKNTQYSQLLLDPKTTARLNKSHAYQKDITDILLKDSKTINT